MRWESMAADERSGQSSGAGEAAGGGHRSDGALRIGEQFTGARQAQIVDRGTRVYA